MTTVDDVTRWLYSLESVSKAVVLEGEVREALFDEEASVGTSSGMALDNEALRDARDRDCNIAVIPSGTGRFPFDEGFSSILMKDQSDRVCGFQVHSEEERARLDADARFVWLSDDFALDTSIDCGDVRFVLPSVPVHALEEATGARDAVICFPSPSTVRMALRVMAPDMPDTTPVFVVSFRI